ncbi:AMP-binding protein [Nonomuraea sp. NPDC049684]|uniref:AMP-binding protein n=1 Tax=unclassified Nonomuraea TaxID=2593643 RepID=UPI0037A0013C
MTWTELVMGSAPSKGDQPAVSDVRTGEVLSYAQFARRVTRAAGGLRRDGLAFGDRVLIDLPLGASLAVAVHAVAWAGGVAVLGGPGPVRMVITRGAREPGGAAADRVADRVYAFRPSPGALPFAGLLNASPVEFGPLAGAALEPGGGRVLDHGELAADLRNLAARLVVGKDDVVVNAAGDLLKGLRVLDLALMSGAHVVIAANEPTVIGCRVLAAERRATMVVAPYDVARRLLGNPILRVVDERAIVSSLGL